MNFQNVRGTKDLFGESIEKFNSIVQIAKKTSLNYNFQEIATPIFEFSDVFERNLGETSDVIAKEVYKFKDKGDNYLSLRPEFTAGIVRSLLNNPELYGNLPLKLFSYGPLFRYDRPQKGRQRQFHQINFEYFGNESYFAEVEMLQLANNLLKKLNLDGVKLEINSLGSKESRRAFELALQEYFTKYKNSLSTDSQVRLEKNVLRILDSKDENDKSLLENAPKIGDFYTAEDKESFDNILNWLEKLSINYEVNQTLVRGLDYYTSTVFEFTTDKLGAQATVLAGGRYDNLVQQMGGASVPAVGFAGGIERLMLLLEESMPEHRPVALIPISPNEVDKCLFLQTELRAQNTICELFPDGKMKKKMNLANKVRAKYAVIIGENEAKNNSALLKDMDSGAEKEIPLDVLKTFLA